MWAIVVALIGMLGGGVWIGITLGITGTLLIYFFAGGASSLVAVPIAAKDMLYKFTWVAVPLYILVGNLFISTGLSMRLYSSLSPLLERFRGKLLLTNVIACGVFGAISGSSMATAAAIGSIAYPELTKRGYHRGTIVGSLAGSGTLGLLVPPSIILIVYGAWQDVSVRALFVAAVVPAIIMVLLFCTYIGILCTVRPNLVPPRAEIVPLKHAIVATKGIWPMAVLIFSIMGTIYLGIATPTEAAAIAVCLVVIMSLPFHMFSFTNMWNAALDTVRIMGMIAIILVGAMILTVAVALLGLPRQVVLATEALNVPPVVIFALIYLLYIVLGCFFEGLSMMLMTLPFVGPIIGAMGYDPVWFGVALVMLTEMAMITPPVGSNLYVLEGITKGEVPIMGVVASAFPYFLLLLLGLIVITVLPDLCLWLPAQMR